MGSFSTFFFHWLPCYSLNNLRNVIIYDFHKNPTLSTKIILNIRKKISRLKWKHFQVELSPTSSPIHRDLGWEMLQSNQHSINISSYILEILVYLLLILCIWNYCSIIIYCRIQTWGSHFLKQKLMSIPAIYIHLYFAKLWALGFLLFGCFHLLSAFCRNTLMDFVVSLTIPCLLILWLTKSY